MRWFHENTLKQLIFKTLRHQKEVLKNRQKWLDKSSPKGELALSTGRMLEEECGYKVRILDLIHPYQSHCYNPFVYLRDDNDVQRLVTNLFKATTPPGSTTQDPFWGATRSCLKRAGTANNLIMLEN